MNALLPAEMRHAERSALLSSITVSDFMTGQDIGLIGNISETGLLLVACIALVQDSLYQLQFRLGSDCVNAPFNVGAQLMWIAPANTPGQYFAGMRFLALSEPQRLTLRHWLETLNGPAPA